MKNNRFIFVNIAYIGALIALQVVLGNLVQIALLTKQMNLGFLPIAVAGYLFGPIGGLLVATLGDVIGTLLFGTGAYFPGFTITAALVGIVYGWILFPKYHRWVNNCCKSRTCGLIIRATVASVIVAILYILLNSYWLTFFIGTGYWAILVGRLPFYALEVPVFTVLISICCSQMKRLPRMLLPDEIRKNIVEKP
ncbi:MAG: folate family ECF transporter S component [Bacillota bacterium]